MGLKSIVTCSATPSARLTLRTSTVSHVEPPLQNFDMSATASPDGVTPLIAAPVNVSFAVPHPPPPPPDAVWELSERTDGAVGLGEPSRPPQPAAISSAAIAMAVVIFVAFIRTQPPRAGAPGSAVLEVVSARSGPLKAESKRLTSGPAQRLTMRRPNTAAMSLP